MNRHSILLAAGCAAARGFIGVARRPIAMD